MRLLPTMGQHRFSALRRRLLVGSGLAGIAGVARPAPVELPLAVSLARHLASALGQGSPLVVLVSLPGCPFCKVARENYLAPMVRDEALPAVQVDMLSKQELLDFKGSSTTHEQQIHTWGVNIAPTVLFFGRGGAEVAQRLRGGSLSDFYGAYLEQRLATARKALH